MTWPPAGTVDDAAVLRGLRLIESSFAGESTLDRLAAGAGLSPFHFHRRFTTVTGSTPHELVTALRIRAAKAELARTGTAVADIARSVGYASAPSFSRQFRRFVGFTPTAFREATARMDGTVGEWASSMRGSRPAGTGRIMCAPVDAVNAVALFAVFRHDQPRGKPAWCAVNDARAAATLPASFVPGSSQVFGLVVSGVTPLLDFAVGEFGRLWVGVGPVATTTARPAASWTMPLRSAFAWESPLLCGIVPAAPVGQARSGGARR